MSPRLRIAASVLALAAAWWLGMLAERSRRGANAGAAETSARQRPPDDDLAARRATARAAELRAVRENADAFPDPASAPPRDLAARFEAALRAPTEVQRARQFIAATNDLTLEEIPSALALATQSGGPKNAREILHMVLLARWAELDPSAAAAYTMKNLTNEQGGNSEIIETVFGEWGMRDPTAAADFVAALDVSKRENMLSGLLAGVAAKQPEAALALLARFPEAAKDSESYEVIFGAWTERDPRSAAARAGVLPPGDLRARALAGVAEHWAQHDPAAAYSWATQLGDPAEQATALRTVLGSWADSDPRAAANQVLRLADATLARDISGDIAREIAQTDLPAAQRFAAQLADEQARAKAQWMVVLRMSEKSITDATAYADQMPEGEYRKSAYYSLSATWFLKDPVATAQWHGTLSPSGSRDSAVAAYVERAVELAPESALAWAASMRGAKMRKESTTKAYQAWQQKAPQAAQAWLDANRTLPDDVRAELTPRK